MSGPSGEIAKLRERMNDYRLRSRSPYQPIAAAYADAAGQIEERLFVTSAKKVINDGPRPLIDRIDCLPERQGPNAVTDE